MEQRAEPNSKICIKCGEITDRYKYCDDCAGIEKIKLTKDFQKQKQGVNNIENSIIEKEYRKHFKSLFTWDQPNDLLC